MGHQLGLMIVALSLFVGDGEGDGLREVAFEPYENCREQGMTLGSPAFDECIERLIEERCLGAGLEPASNALDECVEAYERTLFLARQLEIRGYRLFNESN